MSCSNTSIRMTYLRERCDLIVAGPEGALGGYSAGDGLSHFVTQFYTDWPRQRQLVS